MSKSIKLSNDNYLDSTSIVHNRTPLNELINKYENKTSGIRKYFGTLTKATKVDINITTIGFASVRIFAAMYEDIISYSLCIANKWVYNVSELLRQKYYSNSNVNVSVEIITKDDPDTNVYLRITNNANELINYKVFINGIE